MTAAAGAVAPDQPVTATVAMSEIGLERRVCAAIILITPLLFLLFLAIAPAVNPTFDDAKYVGVGRNFLSGNGPITVFGVTFLKHSPLWPMLIVIPERLFGLHPITTGHIINALSGALTIGLIGYLGWRVRPAIGAVAAVLFASLPYVFDIARTAGIDLPSIALTLGYIVVGFSAVRTGSIWRAIVLGAIFAAAFLIKETILPFAVVPFILGILWGVRWPTIVRSAGVTLAVASLGMSWWFVMFAGYTQKVYRAELPQWTLVPSAIAVVVLLAIALAADRIAAAIERRGWNASAAGRLPARLRSRTFVGWLAVLVWFVLLTIFFGRTPKLLGASLFDPDQIVDMIGNALGSVRLVFAYGLGSSLVVVELLRDRRRVAQASIDVLVATICGIPLVLLVLGVGETPRHYIAELALVVLLATIGWYHGLLRVFQRDRLTVVLFVVLAAVGALTVGLSSIQRVNPRLIVVAGVALVVAAAVVALTARLLRDRGRLALLGTVVASVIFVAGMSFSGARAVRLPGLPDQNETQAAADTIDWLKTTVPAGSTVAFGPYLSMETSLDIPAGYKAIQVRHFLAIADPTAPLGLRGAGGGLADVVAVDEALYKANQFNVYTASRMNDLLKAGKALYYVYPISTTRSSKMVLNVLTPENGFTQIGPPRTYPSPTDTIEVYTYKVDLDRLGVPSDQLFIAPDAFARLLDRLERAPAAGAVAAAALVDRIVLPADGSEGDLMARLKVLAGR